MASGDDIWSTIADLKRTGTDLVVVTVIACRGSVPCVLGAKAVITSDGLMAGTVGGGKVEARVIAEALGMLDRKEKCVSRKWNLQQDVGMTCGGEMEMVFEKVSASDRWHIVVFGAGHVSKALAPVLAGMNCTVDVVDERKDWLERIPESPNVRKHLVRNYADAVALVSENSMVISITKGHTSDRPVLRDTLRQFPKIAFLGVIGSASKRAVLMRELREDGIEEVLLEKIICPLGLPIGGNDPGEIAVSIAAQLLEQRGSKMPPALPY